MQTLSASAYNKAQTQKWTEDYNKALASGRDINCLPQLAFYVFMKNYGQVAFDHSINTACWGKTRAEAIESFNQLTKRRN